MRPDDMVSIFNLIGAFGSLVDKREWDKMIKLFAPRVKVDYTSLFGGETQEQKREDLVAGWAQFLPRFSGTEHHIGQPFVEFEQDEAIVRAAVVAYHFTGDALLQPDSEWVVGGHYRFVLSKQDGEWRIKVITLEALWQKGKALA